MNGIDYWVLKLVDGLRANPKEVVAFNKILADRPINQGKKKDILIPVAINYGNYRVKDDYKYLLHSQRWDKVDIPLKLC